MGKRDYLFVYGTLRKGLNHPMHQALTRYADFVSEGKFRGKLYDLGRYPGAVASEEPSDAVLGELYAFRNKEPALRLLDEYEGSNFRRERVAISLSNKKKIEAWIYLYIRPTNGLKPIPLGDYLKFHQPL